MKTKMKISLILNIVLTGSILFCWGEQRNLRSLVSALTAAKFGPASRPATDASSRLNDNVSASGPFHWSQLESPTGYRTYVANLRAAGCPEATVADIVRGDTARAFALERQKLGSSTAGTGSWSASEESALVADLLKRPDLAADATSDSRPNTDVREVRAGELKTLIPKDSTQAIMSSSESSSSPAIVWALRNS